MEVHLLVASQNPPHLLVPVASQIALLVLQSMHLFELSVESQTYPHDCSHSVSEAWQFTQEFETVLQMKKHLSSQFV